MKKNYQTTLLPRWADAAGRDDARDDRRCRAAGDGRDDERRRGDVRAERQARPGPNGGAARQGGRLGHLGWPPGSRQRPRMRGRQLPVPAFELFCQSEVLGRLARERILAGFSTRRYPGGPEPTWTPVRFTEPRRRGVALCGRELSLGQGEVSCRAAAMSGSEQQKQRVGRSRFHGGGR